MQHELCSTNPPQATKNTFVTAEQVQLGIRTENGGEDWTQDGYLLREKLRFSCSTTLAYIYRTELLHPHRGTGAHRAAPIESFMDLYKDVLSWFPLQDQAIAY